MDSHTSAVEIEWERCCEKGQIQVEQHNGKMQEVQVKLNDLKSDIDKTQDELSDEVSNLRESHEALRAKLEEMNGQKQEFLKYMDELSDKLESAGQNKNSMQEIQQLSKEFELELERFKSALPMYARKTDIVSTIASNQVSIILGETGSGKSTQILQYLNNAGYDRMYPGIIVCTQPRKVAAISLARRVAQEMGTTVGQLVGYQVGMQCRRSANTKLLYVTDRVLLNDCLEDPLFSKYSCIIIDEAHERSIYTDLLMGFIKQALAKRRELHAVVMSATIDPELFKIYFSTDSASDSVPPVLQVSGRVFPVDVVYAEFSGEDYTVAAYRKALEVHRSESPGDILVFLTSPIDTENACKKTLAEVGKNEKRIVVLELHGKLQAEDQQKVFDPAPAEARKIVFATNTAETSITIPGVKYVVDSGKVREVSFDPNKNMSTLCVQWVSQSSAEQRKGRAGRTDSGKCFRMYTKEQFDEMDKESVPEIKRVHLGQALLKLMSLRVSDPMRFDFVEAPPRDAIHSALSVLRELGAYDDNGITEVGSKLAKISLEPRLGKIVMRGIDEGIQLECAVMASVMTVGGSIFFRAGSTDQKERADRKKTTFCNEWGDIITLVNVYKEWNQLPEKNRGKWCQENSFNAKSLRNAKETLDEIRHTFKCELKVIIPESFTEIPEAKEKMARILFECYPNNIARYLGHRKAGYCLATDHDLLLGIYPSSALLYLEEMPKWVVFEEIFTSSKTYMMNATVVRSEWITQMISAGRLNISLASLDSATVEAQSVLYIGCQCVRNLLGNRGQQIRDLQSQVKSSSNNASFFMDVTQFENTGGGTLTLFANCRLTAAVDHVTAWLAKNKKALLDETVEKELLPNCPVRFVMESGARVRTIMMPNEYRRLKIKSVRELDSDEQVKEVLSKYGSVERVDRQKDIWGVVTFGLPHQAVAAMADKEQLAEKMSIDVHRHVAEARRSHQERPVSYTVKVVAQRRPLSGRGWILFDDVSTASLVASRVSTFVMSRVRNGVKNECTVNLQLDKKNPNQLFIRLLPYWANEAMVRSRLMCVAGEGTKIGRITLHRQENSGSYSDFSAVIQDKLSQADDIEASDFSVGGKPPQDREPLMIAYVIFTDSSKAERSVRLLNGAAFNGFPLDAALELKAFYVVPQLLAEFCKSECDREQLELSNHADDSIVVLVKPHNTDPKLSFFTVITSSLNDLVLAKNRLGKLLIGHKFKAKRQLILFMKSSGGKEFQDSLSKELPARLRIDDRQNGLFIHARPDVTSEVERRLEQQVETLNSQSIQYVKLRSYPKGLMKALVTSYDLDQLRKTCQLTLLELIIQQHTIKFQGSDEACEALRKMIDEQAAKVAQNNSNTTAVEERLDDDSELPECPICFVPIDKDAVYVAEYCGHLYCRACVEGVILSSLSNSDIPIQCQTDGCGSPLVLQDFRNLYRGNLQLVYDGAIRSFMKTHTSEYGYCPTPNCSVIYRRTAQGQEGEEFQCSECRSSLCTACGVAYHTDVSCQAYQSGQQMGDDALETWLAADIRNRSRCPKCNVAIEKNGGCMRVPCSACLAHICWWCKQFFADCQSCYAHLNTTHGGVFGDLYNHIV